MPQRSLTMRIRIQDRTKDQEDAILAKVREQLGKVQGDPRPTLEVNRAEGAIVAVEPTE